ncbi:hypothetical protein GQ55_1G130900 [Panicum hallii var. hallii]|uniref:Uncharacterized protein n=1 Tax=Panicum hallii var. hallii TaxID=1504633 RepID=A0A2T7F529_9POAL|nr:hypothetical protein GQ55_1G130900 [Panicum hallii var. hallii]
MAVFIIDIRTRSSNWILASASFIRTRSSRSSSASCSISCSLSSSSRAASRRSSPPPPPPRRRQRPGKLVADLLRPRVGRPLALQLPRGRLQRPLGVCQRLSKLIAHPGAAPRAALAVQLRGDQPRGRRGLLPVHGLPHAHLVRELPPQPVVLRLDAAAAAVVVPREPPRAARSAVR